MSGLDSLVLSNQGFGISRSAIHQDIRSSDHITDIKRLVSGVFVSFAVFVKWLVIKGSRLRKPPGKLPAPIDPIMRVIDDKVPPFSANAVTPSISFAHNHARTSMYALLQHIFNVFFSIIEEK